MLKRSRNLKGSPGACGPIHASNMICLEDGGVSNGCSNKNQPASLTGEKRRWLWPPRNAVCVGVRTWRIFQRNRLLEMQDGEAGKEHDLWLPGFWVMHRIWTCWTFVWLFHKTC